MKNTCDERGIPELLPYSTIVEASNGDADAIHAVLSHYARYIDVLSARTLYDEKGNPHICIDEEMRCRLKAKLIATVLRFQADRVK